jgi:hypothetical protein
MNKILLAIIVLINFSCCGQVIRQGKLASVPAEVLIDWKLEIITIQDTNGNILHGPMPFWDYDEFLSDDSEIKETIYYGCFERISETEYNITYLADKIIWNYSKP